MSDEETDVIPHNLSDGQQGVNGGGLGAGGLDAGGAIVDGGGIGADDGGPRAEGGGLGADVGGAERRANGGQQTEAPAPAPVLHQEGGDEEDGNYINLMDRFLPTVPDPDPAAARLPDSDTGLTMNQAKGENRKFTNSMTQAKRKNRKI